MKKKNLKNNAHLNVLHWAQGTSSKLRRASNRLHHQFGTFFLTEGRAFHHQENYVKQCNGACWNEHIRNDKKMNQVFNQLNDINEDDQKSYEQWV